MTDTNVLWSAIGAFVFAIGTALIGTGTARQHRQNSFVNSLERRLNENTQKMEERCTTLVGRGNLYQMEMKQALNAQNSNFDKQQIAIRQMLTEFRDEHYQRMWSHFKSSSDQTQQQLALVEYRISKRAESQAQAIEALAKDVKDTQEKMSQLTDLLGVPHTDENLARAAKQILKGKKDLAQIFAEYNLVPSKETFLSLAAALG